jgi:hypothetical protein
MELEGHFGASVRTQRKSSLQASMPLPEGQWGPYAGWLTAILLIHAM